MARKRRAKVQKVKSKYYKYINITLIIGFVLVLFIAYLNKEKLGFSPQESSGGGFQNAFSGKFQPGDEDADMPGKLNWGRDFFK